MNIEQMELNPYEKIFSVHVVEVHLSLLRRIHSILVALSSDGSLVVNCYCLLPQGSQVMKDVDEAANIMDFHIIRRMDQFLQCIPAGVDRYAKVTGYTQQIRYLIRDEIPGKLGQVMGKLLAIQPTAQEIHKEMEVDWQNDVQACWEDYLCKPIRREEICMEGR
jgi:hypothetical protein